MWGRSIWSACAYNVSSRLRGLRRGSQLFFFASFVLLFAFAAYPLKSPIPVDLFLRADPLIALSAMVSLRQLVFPLVWFALPLVVLGLLMGRAFCGWICPMGTAIDLSERVLGIRGRRPGRAPQWRRVKFYLLAVLLVTMLIPAAHRSAEELALSESVGLSAVYLLDPIALLTRTFALAVLPAVQWLLVLASDTATMWAYTDFAEAHPWVLRLLDPMQLGLGTVARPVYFRLGLVAFAMFGGMVALGGLARRFWCRNLCPLGALFAILGKASPISLAVSDKCTRCLQCVNECKVGAITEDPHEYRAAECIHCYSCLAVCPEQAISLTVRGEATGRKDELELSRRRVLQATGLGLVAAVLPKVGWGARRSEAGVLKISGAKLIRPPGARAEDAFVTACVRCGECMKVCPTNALQPALGEGGLEALGTPILVPRIGPCTEPCNLCGQVCPTRAIEPFEIEEKRHLYLGTAMIDRSQCLAWAADRVCLVCDEACSYDAISQVTMDGVGRPVVNDRICVGCGICERVCPVQPQGAIHVYATGDKRDWGREAQRAWREAVEQEGAGGSPYPGV